MSMTLCHFIISVSFSCATVGNQQTLRINKDGSVSDLFQLLRCSDGARINLLSYSILNEDCHSNTNCDVKLSPAQQLYIHQQCSLKESCKAMDFPINDARSAVDGWNHFLKVKYECLGKLWSRTFCLSL